MIPYPHQITIANFASALLAKYKLVYLACEERTGKTLASILVAEQHDCATVLVITKKKALDGWNETLAAFEHKKQYTVVNYHQAHKQKKHDLVMLDECFVGSTLVDGKAIRDYKVGDHVVTREGKKRVYHVSSQSVTDELVEVVIGGKQIVCTPDHLFLTSNRGWIQIKEATNEDVFVLQD